MNELFHNSEDSGEDLNDEMDSSEDGRAHYQEESSLNNEEQQVMFNSLSPRMGGATAGAALG